ncbi:unnamed protein product, partial [Adineta ricciae]
GCTPLENIFGNPVYAPSELKGLTHSATPNVTEIECINPKYSYEAMDIETNHVAEQVNENDDTTLANSPNAPIR